MKLGGSLIAHPKHLAAVLEIASDAARRLRLVIVPGGGPFADAVRDVDRAFGLPDDVAHWMAVLGMDQCAHLVTAQLTGSVVVNDRDAIQRALGEGYVPVLAPSRWLQAVDPLPHTWDVTSDSIAAWIATVTCAHRLLLVKAPGAGPSDLVDPYFHRVGLQNVATVVVTADDVAALRTALRN